MSRIVKNLREVKPDVFYVCPDDKKKFNDPQYKCRYCDKFFRLKQDIFGLDVIACYDSSEEKVKNDT